MGGDVAGGLSFLQTHSYEDTSENSNPDALPVADSL
jgi:hypothetical protein